MNFETWARKEADAVFVRFLRKYTHLESLAQLIENGVHLRPEQEVRAYAAKNGITLR